MKGWVSQQHYEETRPSNYHNRLLMSSQNRARTGERLGIAGRTVLRGYLPGVGSARPSSLRRARPERLLPRASYRALA